MHMQEKETRYLYSISDNGNTKTVAYQGYIHSDADQGALIYAETTNAEIELDELCEKARRSQCSRRSVLTSLAADSQISMTVFDSPAAFDAFSEKLLRDCEYMPIDELRVDHEAGHYWCKSNPWGW